MTAPGRAAFLKAQQAALEAFPALIVEPATVASVVGTAVSVVWRGQTYQVPYDDSITGLAAGQSVLLLKPVNGTPFIFARLTGTPT